MCVCVCVCVCVCLDRGWEWRGWARGVGEWVHVCLFVFCMEAGGFVDIDAPPDLLLALFDVHTHSHILTLTHIL